MPRAAPCMTQRASVTFGPSVSFGLRLRLRHGHQGAGRVGGQAVPRRLSARGARGVGPVAGAAVDHVREALGRRRREEPSQAVPDCQLALEGRRREVRLARKGRGT
jgi:hypothetical protein